MIQFGTILGFNSKWYGKALVDDESGRKIVFVHWSALRKMVLRDEKMAWILIMNETITLPKVGDKIALDISRDSEHGYYAKCWAPIAFYNGVCEQIRQMKE